MIKRNSTAGRLAQAIYEARMAATYAENYDPKFPKSAYGGLPSLWVTAALATLEHLEHKYGFAPDANRAKFAETVERRMMDDLQAKNREHPPHPGYAWSLGYDDLGNRHPNKDIQLKMIPAGSALAGVAQSTPLPPEGETRPKPDLGALRHAVLPTRDAVDLALAITTAVHSEFLASPIDPANLAGMAWGDMDARGKAFWRRTASRILRSLHVVSRDRLALLKSVDHLPFDGPSNGVLKLPAGLEVEQADAPETWPVGTPVRVGSLEGKIRHNPPRVRVEFTGPDGAVHHGEFLTKFVHRVEPADTIMHVGPPQFGKSLSLGRIAVMCDRPLCDFYAESDQSNAHAVLTEGEQHHADHPTHLVRVLRNPEETREPVTL